MVGHCLEDEAALVKVCNGACINMDPGRTTVVALLDLRAAFKPVDHDILLKQLKDWAGMSATRQSKEQELLCGNR